MALNDKKNLDKNLDNSKVQNIDIDMLYIICLGETMVKYCYFLLLIIFLNDSILYQ